MRTYNRLVYEGKMHMATPKDIFAQRMRERRIALGMKQTELAEALSERLGATIYPAAVNRIESGQRDVRLNEAVYAADVLRTPLMDLLGGDEDADVVEIRHAQYTLEQAEQLLRVAEEDVEQRSSEVEQAKQHLQALVHRDLEDELEVRRWPLRE